MDRVPSIMLLEPRRLCLWWCLLLAISGSFSVSANSIDWAFNDPNDSRIFYLVSGDSYTKLNSYRQKQGTGQISDLFPGIPSGIEAATWWSGKDKFYFFKDGKYYTADNIGGSVSGPFEGSSLGQVFTRPIEAASEYRGKTYFFQDASLHEYDGSTFKRTIDAGRYGLTGQMDAGVTISGQLMFFDGPMTRMVYPHSFGIIVGSINLNMASYL